jgi:predicted AAA+ superfamily ATPase
MSIIIIKIHHNNALKKTYELTINALKNHTIMKRHALVDLTEWLNATHRRPLILRGARQVGKTWLVRELARQHERELIELNFERDPKWNECFTENDPQSILRKISLREGHRINPETSLLFLDEIQEFPEGLAKLRWFAEECPELAVIAAGSLLEFTLANHEFSMPVGRVTFYNLEPMSFTEFLWAHRQKMVAEELDALTVLSSKDTFFHEQALNWFDRYSFTGGLPAIVQADAESPEPGNIRSLQRQLLATYRADFPKYSKKVDSALINRVLTSIASQIGSKFIYKNANQERPAAVKPTVELLCQARLATLITYSSGNGIPLAAECKEKFRKIGLLDVGLLHALLETPDLSQEIEELLPSMRSRVAEQMVTQTLRSLPPRTGDPTQLFYWQREGGRPGEIDHLIQHQGTVIPIELKSGATGAMKSLHQFVYDKKLKFAIRVDRNPISIQQVDIHTTQSNHVEYTLLNLPIYALSQMDHLIAEAKNNQ